MNTKDRTEAPEEIMAPDEIDHRLLQEEARCARDYDRARAELASAHFQSEGEEEDAKGELRALKERLVAMLDQDGQGDGGAWKEAQPVLERLADARTAKRASYTGALPPTEQALGQPLGTPVRD